MTLFFVNIGIFYWFLVECCSYHEWKRLDYICLDGWLLDWESGREYPEAA
jgi:hypothetical protein